MTISQNRSKVSIVAFVLVLTFAAAFMTCLPAVDAFVIASLTALLWVRLNPTMIVKLLVNGFSSLMPARLAQSFYSETFVK
jgi:hypothetical protein